MLRYQPMLPRRDTLHAQRATRGYQFPRDVKERRDARDRRRRDAIGPQCHIIQWHVAASYLH